MKYYSLICGDKEYKLRIASKQHADLDLIFKDKGGFFKFITSEDGLSDCNDVFKKIVPIAARTFADENGKLDAKNIGDLFDALVDENDWGVEEFIGAIIGICEVSCFFPKGSTAEMAAEKSLTEREREKRKQMRLKALEAQEDAPSPN